MTSRPGLWVQFPLQARRGKLEVPVSDGSRAVGEEHWDSVPGSPTSRHYCVVHSTSSASAHLPGVLEEVVSIS